MTKQQQRIKIAESVRNCLTHHHACECREQAFLELLVSTAPIMEAWAKSHELAEWHCRVERLIGTAYPAFYNHPILPDMDDNQ